jgi:hypothetical protein
LDGVAAPDDDHGDGQGAVEEALESLIVGSGDGCRFAD